MKNWIFTKGKVGQFKIGQQITDHTNLLKLERYPAEDYDTYEINNSNHSKLSIKNGILISILCGDSCIYNEEELIGLDQNKIENMFSEFTRLESHEEIYHYNILETNIELICHEKKIKWVHLFK